ncbi:MAG: COX15/CtaA family protein [Candidatus Krumholzibacteriia bacterium]
MTSQATAVPPSRATNSGSDLLALGFGITVAMWAVGYICRFPGVGAPAWVLMAFLLLCLGLGGWVAGRCSTRGVRGGVQAGVLAGALNLLVLGSLLSHQEAPNQLVPSAVWWLPGSLLLGGLLGGLGALLARRRGNPPFLAVHGLGAFAVVAAVATFMLIIAGGIVTGSQAGLAVVDWPNSYGYNMFLYPLTRMTGGIYYEHVHRLFGSLVGLTTIVLAVQLWRVEPRRWLKRLGLAAVALVIVQGLLGGLRVTGHFTLSDDPALTRPNLWLAVVHGITGQLFFGLMVAIAAFTSRTWQEAGSTAAAAGRDRTLPVWLLAVVMTQLTIGSVLRHTDAALHLHITMALVVVSLGVILGSRLAIKQASVPVLRRLGHGLMHGVVLQFLLGFGALFARSLSTPGNPHPADVVVTTVHQAFGALILALAVLSVLWTRRLLRPATP